MTQPVVTRFAPSPTGDLHIGSARTALFNWLYAKAHGGKMLLRIEDTDRERSTDASTESIINGLKWLGLDWDGLPISQFSHNTRHKEVAEQLLAEGHAYRCYTSSYELNEMRQQALSEGRPPCYDGRWRDRDPDEAPANIQPVIRLKTPMDGETVIDDQVQGRIVWQNNAIDDFIILRADGTPTYMHAVVVDDHDMGVTHIIRGDDHLTNAARQAQLYRSLKWENPIMAHIPLIHGQDSAKLSKRHGTLGIEAYRDMGYLPNALRNYLIRLGWSHGNDEIISLEQMIEWFDLSSIGRASAKFDFVKLKNINGHYIRTSNDEDLVANIATLLSRHQPDTITTHTPTIAQRATLLAAMPELKKRARTLLEIWNSAAYLFAQRPIILDSKASQTIADGGKELLTMLLPILQKDNDWSSNNLEHSIKDFANQQNLQLSQVAQPLRAALTGSLTSPGIFEVLAILGRDESLGRISDQSA